MQRPAAIEQLHVIGQQLGLEVYSEPGAKDPVAVCQNALKHAHASNAFVTFQYTPEELQIEVRDDGEGRSTSDGLGHGLVGIRERVKIYGGEMTAGTAAGGGFVLSSRLPLGRDER